MKRIIYFHQYFKTPEEGGALRSYFIATGMVDRGISVAMITTHNLPNYDLKNIEGITVHYLPIHYSNKMSFYQRIFSFLKYVFKAIKLVKKLEKPNLIYATSTPLTVGLIALWINWKWNIPYVFEVRDLWPEAPIQLGILKSKPLIFVLKSLEKSTYRHAAAVVALSPGIKKGISQCFNHLNIHIIPNMADISFFQAGNHNRKDDVGLTLGYFGAFGSANGLEFILQLAKVCQEKNVQVTFILVGSGNEMVRVRRLSEDWSLENITFYDHVARNEVKKMIAKVDGCITSFMNKKVLQTNSPNKFFDGLAAGKLSIVNTKGWLKELVEQFKCGFYIDPESPEEIIDKIIPFIENNKVLKSYQENALNLAKELFSREILVKKLCDLVEDLTKTSKV